MVISGTENGCTINDSADVFPKAVGRIGSGVLSNNGSIDGQIIYDYYRQQTAKPQSGNSKFSFQFYITYMQAIWIIFDIYYNR